MTPPTETDLLRAKIAREQALVGLINSIRDLVIDARAAVLVLRSGDKAGQ